MRKFATVAVVAVALLGATLLGCGTSVDAIEDYPAGTKVTIETRDGDVVEGELIAVDRERVVLDTGTGAETTVPRVEITDVDRRDAEGWSWFSTDRDEFIELPVPLGTIIKAELTTPLASNTSAREDRVRARVREQVTVQGRVAIPVGSELLGTVTRAQPSGEVKGRATLAVRFDELTVQGQTYSVVTKPIVYEAAGTKKEDAAKIGIGAAAGAIVGGIAGGGKGAAVGSAIGGGAGTAVVLMTPGKEVSLAAGTALSVQLEKELTLQIRRETT